MIIFLNDGMRDSSRLKVAAITSNALFHLTKLQQDIFIRISVSQDS